MWAALIAIAAVIVLVILVMTAAMSRNRRHRNELQTQFRDEYDRAVAEHGSTKEAVRDLEARTERHEHLDISPLDESHRQRFSREWTETQAEFVDRPEAAVAHADCLVQEVMQERGYPVRNFEQQVADLSVEHADVLNHYRAAHDVYADSSAGRATTESLRQGMVHYRALFTALLDEPRRAEDAEQRSYS